MKVMTSKTEARGLQSRTEVRQTVAQMAAPNFKDSAPEDSPGQVMIFPRANSYFATGKLGLCSVQTRTLLRAKSRFASGKLLARRVLLLLTLFVMSVGSAWGDPTFQEEGSISVSKDGGTFYLGTPSSGMSFNVLEKIGGSSQLLADINEALGSTVYTNIDDLWKNIYVRWIGIQGDGNVAKIVGNNYIYYSNEAWNFAGVGDYASAFRTLSEKFFYTYYYGPDQIYWNPGWWGKDTFENDLFGLTWFYNGYASNLSDAKIVCYVSTIDQVGATKGNDHGQGSFSTEGTLLVKYTFLAKKKPDTFSGKLKSGGQALSGGSVVGTADKLNASDVSATLDFSAALAQASSSTYVRFYLEKDGEAVDPTGKLTVTGGTAGPDKEHGFYIYKSGGLSSTDVDNDVTLELTAGEYEDYQVVAVFGSGEPSGDPLHEVDWDLQYKYTFEYPFKGDASSATVVEKTFSITESKKTQTLTMAYDIANNKITLKDGSDNTIGEVNVDASTFWSAYGSALSGSQPFYVRWFLQDKSGAEATSLASAGAIVDGGSSLYAAPAKDRYGLYFSTTNGTNALNDIMKIKVDGSKVSDLAKYDLVCTIATNLTGEVFDGSSKLTHEPNAMVLKYVLKFEDKPFEAENLYTVKTVYKTALYDKTTGKITPQLFSNKAEVLGELGTNKTTMSNHGYFRWYVIDNDNNIVSDIDDWSIVAGGPSPTFVKRNGYGSYDYKPTFYDWNDAQFDAVITLPGSYDKLTAYKNYKVVCVVTSDDSGISLPDNEPTTMQVKYVFNLMTSDELAALPFVHYKGQSGRDWVKPEGSTGSQAQKYWDNSAGEAKDITDDIRQGVHTWEYNVYVKTDDERELILPIEKYTEGSNNLEPRAYFRWYDYLTDRAVAPSENYTFTNAGSKLNVTDRGSFALNIGENPKQANVGVTFKAKTGFPDTGIHIACDVSKYSDGILDISGTSYLQHEPTLSTRYIFHIYPATVISSELATAKTTLEDAETVAISNGKLSDMETALANLPENKGKMVVSLGEGNTGEFALRLDEHSIANYVLENGTVTPTVVNWYAYVEYDGKVYCKKLNTSDNSDRIRSFEYTDFTGDYTELGSTATKSISEAAKYHVVVYVGEGTYKPETKTGTYAPVAHYELHFLEAPPVAVENLKNNKLPLNRTDEYMNYHYRRAGLVDFDGNPETDYRVTEENKNEYYSTEHWYDPPTSSANNMTWMPREWDDIQYGFCYPQLTSTIKNGAGDLYVSPEHGDYMMVKTMNISGISDDNSDVTAPHKFDWWKTDELYDYTHTYTDDTKYGSFLYTDASNESRSIATIPFTGTLCAGSMLYFTAAVADMTSGGIKPQLVIRIYGIKGDGTRESLVAFHTCDIITAGASTGAWYQVYGESVVPTTFDNSITSFVAEVINYANDTNGADFAIDQIAVYISTAKVKALFESSSLCDETNKIRIFADAENLRNSIGTSSTKNIYYRLFERIGDADHNTHNIMEKEALVGTGVYSDDPAAPTGYGVVPFNPSYNISELTTTKPADSGYYIGDDGSVMFQLANREFGLDPSKTYFVSIYSLTEDKPGDTVAEDGQASGWGCPYNGEECSVYSNDINAQKIFIQLKEGSNDVSGSVSIGCGATSVPKNYNLVLKYPKITGGHTEHEEIKFDIFLGSRDEFKAAQTSDNLKDALDNFRTTYTTQSYTSSADLPSDYQTAQPAYYAAIKKYMDDGKLVLQASTAFSHTFTDTDNEVRFCVEPIQKKLSDDSEICSPIEMIFNVSTGGGGPVLELGFNDVDYSKAGKKRVVRVGLEQLSKMRAARDAYKLHIPVAKYEDKAAGKTNKIYFSNAYLTISAVSKTSPTVANSTDPTTSVGTKFAKIENTDDVSTDPYVDNTHMYLSLNLSGKNCAVDFHEGYEYEVSTSFYDETDASTPETDRCNGDLYLVIKVVPEFVTWESLEVGSTGLYNANWYNDANWHRSERAELYKKGTVVGEQNTETLGHPDGYKNNEEVNSSLTSIPRAYVPMKFTYVTMPTNNHAPDLIGETYETTGSVQNGGYLINLANTMTTNTSPVGTHLYNSAPTDNIRYDMLVRYGTHAEGGEGCFGHPAWDGSAWVSGTEVASAKVFDVEKFYGNICKEIYFKPGAELLQQQRLKYEKAWVEKELEPNKWYLMSTPLQGTYAGDMYVPTTMTNVASNTTVEGRQVTEAFQPITFNTTTYGRTKYPIYQRSWGKDASVYTTTDDIRANSYSAKIGFTSVSANVAEWGHTYNDVQVPYNTFGGFSIRANRKAMSDNALIRLPKNDERYDYYQYDGKLASSGGISQAVTKGSDMLGRFVFDNKSSDMNKVELTLSKLQAQGVDGNGNTYYLIGNPFMSSLDMGLFFSQNTAFATSYYTYEGSTLTAVNAAATPTATSKNIIKPLQAFFVKCAASSAPEKVIITRQMMTDGNWEFGTTASGNNGTRGGEVAAVTLKAVSEEGSSVASIAIGQDASDGYDEGEDVETLFDSNLDDVPMVYTVAGNKAVSIDVRRKLDVVPFGVSCGSSDEMVSVKFSWSENSSKFTVDGLQFTDGGLQLTADNRLYVLDAVTGETTEVTDGQTVSVQPNDYGRYFLTTRGGLTAIQEAKGGNGIVVSVRNKTLTVRSDAGLKAVRIVTVGGETVASAADCGTEASFALANSGVYIVEAQTASGGKTMKAVVR